MKALQCTPLRAAVYVALLIAGSLGTAHLAVAQEPTPDQQSAIRSNCRSDFMANCSGVPRGGKEAMQCLKDHVAVLSAGCQQAVKAVMPAPAAKPPRRLSRRHRQLPLRPSSPCAGGARRCDTAGSRRSGRCSCRFNGGTRRGETGGACRIDAASGAGTAGSRQACDAGSEKRCETSCQRASRRSPPRLP